MRSLLAFIFVLFAVQGFSNSSRDSVGIENNNGLLVILHKVESKENYYSIGRIYQVSPKTIIDFNNNLSLQIGIVIKIPTSRSFTQQLSTASQAANSEIIEYKVGPKEFLYLLARRFNTTIEDIKALNDLRSNKLSIGQILKIRPGTPVAPEPVVTVIPEVIAAEPEKPKVPVGRLGISEQTERGVAIWIADDNLDGTKMLALHRTAPPGTVVKVTNPMTDKVTYVKVVGKFTENESTKDAIIVLTKATADLLGVLDKRFQVIIDYSASNE